MKWKLPLLALTALLSMSACGSINANRSLDCPGWVRPILTEEADILTDATAREIVVHNELYDTFCGSAPPPLTPTIGTPKPENPLVP